MDIKDSLLLIDEAAEATEREEAHLREWKQRIDDAREVFGTPAGRRILWFLLEYCQVFTTTYTGNSQSYFNEGKRFIGLVLLGLTRMRNPEGLDQIIALKEEQENG